MKHIASHVAEKRACRAHNLLAAEQTFGKQKMARYTTRLGPGQVSASKVREPEWQYAV